MAIIPTTIRQPDGTLAQTFFDTTTGQAVQQPVSGVQTNDQFTQSLADLGMAPTAPVAPQAQTTSQRVVSAPKEQIQSGSRGERGGTGYTTSNPNNAANNTGGFGSNSTSQYGRSASNNYGYVNKPAALGLAGMLPGPAGLAGKALNTGINISNTIATGKAREQMGLDKRGFGAKIGSALRDKKGHVADVQIGSGQFSVGLEAQDPFGRTTLTPTEAQRRAVANQTSIVEATPAQSKARRAEFKRDFPSESTFGRVKERISSVFSSIFGQDIKAAARNQDVGTNTFGTKAFGNITAAKADSSKNSFPSAPSSPKGGNTSFGGYSSQGARDRASSVSPGAAGAIGKGSGGLY